jgi:hypothetical protein
MLGTITLLPVSQYSIFLLHMKGNVHLYTVIAEFFLHIWLFALPVRVVLWERSIFKWSEEGFGELTMEGLDKVRGRKTFHLYLWYETVRVNTLLVG